MLDPIAAFSRYPPDHILDALAVHAEIARKNRFVVSDAIAQSPQGVEPTVGPFAGQRRAMREHPHIWFTAPSPPNPTAHTVP